MYSWLLVFLICRDFLLLLLHLLGGDNCLLIRFTGHLATRLALLLLIFLSLLLGGLAGVNAGLVAVALPSPGTYGRARIGDARSNAGFLSFQ